MFCPACRSEFNVGVQFCQSCEVDLVNELDRESIFRSPEAMAEALDGRELRPIMVSSHVELEKVQQILSGHQIPSILANEDAGEFQAGVASRFFLMIDEDDFEKAGSFLNESWQEGVQREGIVEDIGLGDAEVCPACGTDVPSDSAECTECGLYLGLGEE